MRSFYKPLTTSLTRLFYSKDFQQLSKWIQQKEDDNRKVFQKLIWQVLRKEIISKRLKRKSKRMNGDDDRKNNAEKGNENSENESENSAEIGFKICIKTMIIADCSKFDLCDLYR